MKEWSEMILFQTPAPLVSVEKAADMLRKCFHSYFLCFATQLV